MDKNIIFITNLHLWSLEKGKGGRAFITTVESYIKDGWGIWFISTGGNIPDEVRDQINCYEFYSQKLKDLLQNKFRIVRFLGKFLNVFLNNRFYLKTAESIIKSNKDKHFVIYAYEVEGVLAGKMISEKYHMPLVTRFQGTIIADIKNNIINRIRYYPHFSALKTKADVVIMTNDGTKGLQTLNRLGNVSSKVFFWRNGVNVIHDDYLKNKPIFRNQLGWKDEFVFLMVSRLVSWKRVERAIYAMRTLIKSTTNTKLVIVGDGDSRNELEQLSKDLELTHFIEFCGAIPQDEVYRYMVAADGFLSLYDLSNVGNPLMEAMGCGLPIITLNNGDTSEVIHHNENGILIENSDLEEIPNYMQRFICDREYVNRLRKNARDYSLANFWTWKERMDMELTKVSNLLDN